MKSIQCSHSLILGAHRRLGDFAVLFVVLLVDVSVEAGGTTAFVVV